MFGRTLRPYDAASPSWTGPKNKSVEGRRSIIAEEHRPDAKFETRGAGVRSVREKEESTAKTAGTVLRPGVVRTTLVPIVEERRGVSFRVVSHGI